MRFGIPVWGDLCDDRQKDLLRPALEAIIDLGHPLVRLAGEIDWGFLDRRFGRGPAFHYRGTEAMVAEKPEKKIPPAMPGGGMDDY